MTGETPLKTIVDTIFRDRLPRLEAAAQKLGGITIRVINDTDEALRLLRAQHMAQSRKRFPDATEQQYEELAATGWPERVVAGFMGPEAVSAVAEITFYENYSLMDLHQTAAHGSAAGHKQL